MAGSENEDEREIELDSIKAIFQELQTHPEDAYTAFLDIQVTPEAPLPIVFPPADGVPPTRLPTPPSSDHDSTAAKGPQPTVIPVPLEIHHIPHLPPLRLQIKLPKGYPEDKPPQFTLSTDPSWIPGDTLENLELNGLHLWHEYGRGQVVFAYIDQLQQSAERAFGLAVDGPLSLPQDMRIAILDFNRKAKRLKFESETFDCGVCLEPKKGSVCHRITRCGHVFCISCLQDFYNSCITEGDIGSVKCLAPGCGADQPRGQKQKTLSPSQLLQIPLEHDMVKRYVELKHKKKLESDTSTVYCPRRWCQGPARSKKVSKITDLAAIDSSDSSDDEQPSNPKDRIPPPSERLAICSKCQYAFCRVCNLGWHGEYVRCGPKEPAELSTEEKASFDYIRLHTSPCPTCASPCQKSHGCNHMRCFQCHTHFCYLCSTWLDAGNPYRHFNEPGKACYMRLWELEDGDNGQGRDIFAGVRMAEQEAFALEQQALEMIEDEDQNQNQNQEERIRAQAAGDIIRGGEIVDGIEINGADAEWIPPAPQPPRQAQAPEVVVMMNQINLQGRAPQGREFLLRPQEHGARQNRGPPPQQRQDQQRRNGNGRRPRPQLDPLRPAANEQWNNGIRRFLDMAEADEEDGWDSDELEDDEDWEIPQR